MKITKRQLRRIIREAVASGAKKLFVQYGDYGYIGLEDDAGNDYGVGDLVGALLDAGATEEIFTSRGQKSGALEKILASKEKGVQGGIERWDSDVFETYYDIDTDRAIKVWATMNGMTVEEVDVLPSEAPPEYEDDGTNAFEEYYS